MSKAKTATAPAKTGATVTVACKTPNGIVLRLQEATKVSVPVMGGGFKEVTEFRPHPSVEPITVFGNRVPFGAEPKCKIVGGYALTPGVPADFWAKWLEQNQNLDLVKSGLISAHETLEFAEGEANENSALRSGMEPLTPGQDDPRIPKRRSVETGKLESVIQPGTQAAA